ncbi:hypothetical protein FGG78_32365 [Thioclava sp. BHET1]|nr:hypothetical protein FGG78_32365 [Thioclava sp. BHET1]
MTAKTAITLPNGYEITERTRFRVRYEIHPGRTPARLGVYWVTGLLTPEDCQRTYIAAREAAGLGGSQFGTGEIFDEMGQYLAQISYNGRLWPAESWTQGQQCLAEAPRD